MEQETKLICRLKNTEILKLKEEISSLQQTKLVTAKTDDTIHKIPNMEPVKEKWRVSQARQLSDMQKLNDEWKDCKNRNQGTDQQVQNKSRLHVTQKYQDHSSDKLEETESLSTLHYTREFTRNETSEMDEENRPSRKPDHNRVKTKKCYQCGDDKHLIRDCTVGLKSWARYSRMQPCYICLKTGHKQTNCWFRNKKSGEKPCFHCGSNEHIVKNCSLPRQTNASLAMEENHSCFAQGDREHDENDWYTRNEERIRTLVMDAIHESLQRYGMSLPEGPSWEFPKPKVPKPQERLMFQDLMMLIFDDANTFLESPVPLPPRGQQIPGYCLNVGYWWWAVLLSTLHVTCRTTRIFRSYWISAFLLNWSWRPDMRLWLSLIIIRVPVPQSKYYNIVYKVDTQACL